MTDFSRRASVVLIDNYDSFTYNLYQYACQLVREVQVFRNDSVSVEEVVSLRPDYILVSPGPKDPAAAGISSSLIHTVGATIPVFGVCLGHQCINEAFGGRTIRAQRPLHGQLSEIVADGRGVYRGLPQRFSVARYHSLVADPSLLGTELEVSSRSVEGDIMGLRHQRFPIEGVQFHPESFLTDYGFQMMSNFFEAYGEWRSS